MAKTTRQRSNDPNQNAAPQTSRTEPNILAQTKSSAARTSNIAVNTPSLRAKKGAGFFGKKDDQLIIGRENYKWALIGMAVMAVGFICMSGGAMPSPDVWDESIIYSPIRIILAPFLIIAGLVVVVYAIFVKGNSKTAA